jgi:hypothetical protein
LTAKGRLRLEHEQGGLTSIALKSDNPPFCALFVDRGM